MACNVSSSVRSGLQIRKEAHAIISNMKKFLMFMTIFMSMTTSMQTVHAQETPPPIEPESGAVVCEPGVYLSESADCLPLGPSSYLTDLARLGMSIPPRPLPASKPDPGLTQLPYYY